MFFVITFFSGLAGLRKLVLIMESDKKKSSGFFLNSRRVLIVDDDARMARSIQRTLVRHGYTTDIAFDCYSALTRVEEFQPAVITLDLVLPGMGGADFIRFIRNRMEYNSLKILTISARLQDELEQARKAGADDILEKPFLNEMLVEKVGALF
ncbi:MAG: response regulator [Chitinispirillaceae bacterium]